VVFGFGSSSPLRRKGGFSNKWMSRLEVVDEEVGLGKSGAWVGHALFSKGPTLGRRVRASEDGKASLSGWGSSRGSHVGDARPETAPFLVPPSGSNVIGIWLARGGDAAAHGALALA